MSATTSAGRGVALAMTLLVMGPACSPEAPARRPPRSAPAVTLTRDENLALQTSAYVELHLWLTELGTHPELHAPPALAPARDAYATALRDTVTDALAYRTTRALSACDSADCARAALAAAGLAPAFQAALPWFLARAWPTLLARTDQAKARLRASLPESTPHLVAELARTLEAPLPAPDAVVRLDVVHTGARFRDAPYAPLALEDSQPGLRGRDEDRAEALACTLFQVALALRSESVLFRRIDLEVGRDDRGRFRATYIYALVAAHAARIAVRAAVPGGRERFTATLLEREPEADAYLARRFSERAQTSFVRELAQATTP